MKAKLMDNRPRPDLFYKYTCLAAIEDLCRNRRMRWGAPRSFNDPFDMRREQFVNFTASELADALSDAYEEIFYGDRPIPKFDAFNFCSLMKAMIQETNLPREQFREHNRELATSKYEALLSHLSSETEYWLDYANRARVLCLSEEKNNLAMWAHYGAKHKGAVIALRGVKQLDSAWLAAEPVVYKQALPEIFTARSFAEQSASGIYDGRAMFRDQVFTKSEDWKYEHEWRVYKLLDADDGQDYWNNQTLEQEVAEIYLGCRVSDLDCDSIKVLVRANFPGCRLYKGRISRRCYEIRFDDL